LGTATRVERVPTRKHANLDNGKGKPMGIPINSELGQRILELAGVKYPGGRPPWEHISEKEFQAAVKAEAKRRGWLGYHTHDSRKSEAGFPDLILLRETRIIAAELKAEDGKTTAAQDKWLEAFMSAKAEVYVWRPRDWQHIMETLQ
jgi:hypothetical protein